MGVAEKCFKTFVYSIIYVTPGYLRDVQTGSREEWTQLATSAENSAALFAEY